MTKLLTISTLAAVLVSTPSLGARATHHHVADPVADAAPHAHYLYAADPGIDAGTPEEDTLELPFFDDFSTHQDTPNPEMWTSKGVEINNHMPMNPPSTGVLMLDALNSQKRFYPNAKYGTQTPADTIESLPINLLYPGSKSIYLSYSYQSGGLGDAPEPGDSLILEFYSPTERKWQKIKSYEGGKCEPFKQEIIQISESKYLQKGFKFRFRNYISLGSQLAPDLVSNCDFWMIDYVYLNTGRNPDDTQYSDVALTALPEVLIGEYQQVPWTHYQNAAKKPETKYNIKYRNNDSKARLLDSINMYLEAEGKNTKYSLGSYNMPAAMDFENENNINFTFESSGKEASYNITVKLVSDALQADYPNNNSITIQKTLSNQYAYDDGTAEAAYGLQGEGASGGLVAEKFTTLKPDRILGVYMYFCPVYNNRQASNFNLKIWDCENGLPKNAIYTKRNVQVPKDNTEEFVLIPIDEIVEVADTFFIGWEKNENAMIAIGFDKNTTSANPKYYNIGGKWKQSKEPGQIMMRPAFGDITTPTHDIEPGHVAEHAKLKIWPNPASDFIRISGLGPKQQRIQIISISGKPAAIIESADSEEINIQQLPADTYIIQAPAIRASAKFIKTK